MSYITLSIPGKPRTKGSFIPIRMGNKGTFLKDSDKHLAEWTNLIKFAWTDWCELHIGEGETHDGSPPAPSTEPFELCVLCEFARPKSHFRTGKHAGDLKSSAPEANDMRRIPDCDKVLRAVMDALQGLCWKNDSQVVKASLRKRWGDTDLTTILITDLILEW